MMRPRTGTGTLSDLVPRVREGRSRILGVAAGIVFLVGLLSLPTVDDSSSENVAAEGEAEDTGDVAAPRSEAAPGEAGADSGAGSDGDADSEEGSGAGPEPGGDPAGSEGSGTPATEAPGTGGKDDSEPDDGPDSGPDVDPGVTRGVGEDLVTIGVAIPDLGQFGTLSEEHDLGDVREQFESILDAWRRSERLPVHGRDVTFVYRDYDILSSEEKIAACKELIQDEEAFVVVAGRFFGEGAQCVAERFETPLITYSPALSDVYERGAPYYFSLRPALADMFRNFVAWADEGGHLEDRTIGLYYEEHAQSDVESGIKRALAERGYEIEEEVVSEGAGIGSTQDQIAVQRFQRAGVDLVMPLVGGSSTANFTRQAESQGYRPQYITTDYSSVTTDAGTSLYDEDQWDGTLAMTTGRVGEVRADMSLSEEAKRCVASYERYSGKQIGHESPESAEYDNLLVSCDLAEAMLSGVEHAGRQLGHRTVLQGLEGIEQMALARHGDLGFAAGQHWGVRQQRTISWSKGCGCWTAHGDFRPFGG